MPTIEPPPLRGLVGFGDYQAAVSASIYPIRIDLAGDAGEFGGRIQSAGFGGVSLTEAYANSAFHCARKPSSGGSDGSLLIKCQTRGRTSYMHRDRAMVCDEGSLALFCGSSEIEGEQHCAAHAIVARLPAEMVATHAPHLRRHVGTVAAADRGAARMLSSALCELWNVRDMASAAERRLLPLSLLKLVEIAFCNLDRLPDGAVDATGSPEFGRLRRTIEEALGRSELSVEHLCRRLAMSRSSLYTLTAAAGTTPERLIFDIRLDRAREMLTSKALDGRSVGWIAFAVGFQDLSHFSRRFKTKFGISPLACRQKSRIEG